MSDIFKKLNWKNQPEILVINAPQSFEPELAALETVSIQRNIDEVREINFSLAFVTKKSETDALAELITDKVKGDAIVWFAYPKGTSKNYHCDFNRDNGWDVLKGLGFLPIRQVAIDEDWSALRFRREEFIKTITRKF